MFAGTNSHADSPFLQRGATSSYLRDPDTDDRQWRRDRPHDVIQAVLLPPAKVTMVVKGAVDFLVALVLLVPAAPVLMICTLLVKLTSRGPAFYSQVRLGKGGRPFWIYKIRTMVHNCEHQSGIRWSTAGDPRVTSVGRFLRATHLDELPQLWNILRGEMSLVGPRPERPEIVGHLEAVVPGYRDRLLVRPGVTGLAQIQLPPDTDLKSVRNKVACDRRYIRRVGAWLDIRIIALTVLHVFGVPCHRLCRLLLPTTTRAADCSPAPALAAPHC
jgi:lipopolysaccharide/colanic/teichoic acid biosynthesis glycosyltransferase